MAAPNFTGTIANIYPSSFLAVYVKDRTAEHWQTLGAISGGVLNVEDFQSPDSLTRNRAIGASHFTAKCNMMQCSVTEQELLPTLCNGTNDFLFKLSDAATVAASAAYAGWVEVRAAQVNCKWKVINDGSPENNRVIELSWEGSILRGTNQQIALFTPTLAAVDFAGSGDSTGLFMGIGTYTAATDGGLPTNANIRPCGVSSVSLDTSPASGAEVLSPVMNVKFSLEELTAPDDLLRPMPLGIDLSLEYDWMATLNADMLLLDNLTILDTKMIVTMLDAVAYTFDNQMGLHTNYEVSGGVEKARVLRFTHKGKVLNSTLAGIVA
jgi:hypothetical protein